MSVVVLDSEYSGSLSFDEYSFKLSDFQKHAIDGFKNNKNVFISAPTGSGKTLPAEYAIMDMVKNGKKTIYASPIKTLSNQKFNEFTNKFPEADVGILTGDIKYNPTGNVLIMTTEILRNLLFNKTLHDYQNKIDIDIDVYNEFSLIVFDEIHYINDKDRGSVWEQSIMLLPNSTQMIMLSATINNPEQFCEWISKIKNKDTYLCRTNHRVVPLRHAIFTNYLESFLKKTDNYHQFDKFNNQIVVFSNEENKFNEKRYQEVLSTLKLGKNGLSKNHVYGEIIAYLKNNKLVPCIFFCFSRMMCERLSKQCNIDLLDRNEKAEVKRLIYYYLKKLDNPDMYSNMEQFYNIQNLLLNGIGFHHSGLLPILKEIVELLYSKNLVKVLFATETFAVGVNMPTKTVIFTSLEKFSDNDFRFIQTHEYLQMGGRAGRRGLDKEGLVILLPNTHILPSPSIMRNLICGNSQTIKSKFSPEYQLLLKMICNDKHIDTIISNSLLHSEISDRYNVLSKKLKEIDIPDSDYSEFIQYDKLKNPGNDGYIRLSKKDIKARKIKIQDIENRENFKKDYDRYCLFKNSIEEQDNLKSMILNTQRYIQDQIEKTLEILFENHYIESKIDPFHKKNITLKGYVASQINECNQIILTELVCNHILDNVDFLTLGAILSMFSDTKPVNKNIDINNDVTQFKSYIKFVDEVVQYYQNYEISLNVYNNMVWSTNTYIMNATYQWLNGDLFENITIFQTILGVNLGVN